MTHIYKKIKDPSIDISNINSGPLLKKIMYILTIGSLTILVIDFWSCWINVYDNTNEGLSKGDEGFDNKAYMFDEYKYLYHYY